MSSYRVNRSVLLTATRTGKLDLHGLNIEQLPEEVFAPQMIENLQVLDISDNNFRQLPPEISKLTNLRDLIADHNKLKDLPIELCDIPNFRGISLDGNATLESELNHVYKHSKMIFKSRVRDSLPVLHYLAQREEKRNREMEEQNHHPGVARRASVDRPMLDMHRLPIDRQNAPYAEDSEAISQRGVLSTNKSELERGLGHSEGHAQLRQERSQAAKVHQARIAVSNAFGEDHYRAAPEASAPQLNRKSSVGKSSIGLSQIGQMQSQYSLGPHEQEPNSYRGGAPAEDSSVRYGRRAGNNPGRQQRELPPFGSDLTIEQTRIDNERLDVKNSARNASKDNEGKSSLITPYAAQGAGAVNPSRQRVGIASNYPQYKQFQSPFATHSNQESYITSNAAQSQAANDGAKHRQEYLNARAAGVPGEELAQRGNYDRINQEPANRAAKPHQLSQISLGPDAAQTGDERRSHRAPGALRPEPDNSTNRPYGTNVDLPSPARQFNAARSPSNAYAQGAGAGSDYQSGAARMEFRAIRDRARGNNPLW